MFGQKHLFRHLRRDYKDFTDQKKCREAHSSRCHQSRSPEVRRRQSRSPEAHSSRHHQSRSPEARYSKNRYEIHGLQSSRRPTSSQHDMKGKLHIILLPLFFLYTHSDYYDQICHQNVIYFRVGCPINT